MDAERRRAATFWSVPAPRMAAVSVRGGLVEHVDGLPLAVTKTKSQQPRQRSARRQRNALPPRGVNGTGVTRPSAGRVRACAFSTCLVRILQGHGRGVGFLIRELICGDQQIFVITQAGLARAARPLSCEEGMGTRYRSCDFTAHMCTGVIRSNYKLFVNPLFKLMSIEHTSSL